MKILSQGWSHNINEHNCVIKYKHVFDELSVVNGLQYRSSLLVVPDAMRNKVLTLAHEGHIGMRAMKRRVRETFWWPALDRQVEHFVRDCMECDKSQVTIPSPVETIEVPDKPLLKVAIDIIGPLYLSANLPEYGFVLMDFHSRWPEIKWVRTSDSTSVIKFLKSLFAREGFPEELLSDNGPQFVSAQFEDFLRSFSMKMLKRLFII